MLPLQFKRAIFIINKKLHSTKLNSNIYNIKFPIYIKINQYINIPMMHTCNGRISINIYFKYSNIIYTILIYTMNDFKIKYNISFIISIYLNQYCFSPFKLRQWCSHRSAIQYKYSAHYFFSNKLYKPAAKFHIILRRFLVDSINYVSPLCLNHNK